MPQRLISTASTRLRPFLARMTAIGLVLAAGAAPSGVAATQAGSSKSEILQTSVTPATTSGQTVIVEESFRGASRPGGGWIYGGSFDPIMIDEGLRLTNATSQNGFTIYNLPQPTSAGLDIRFSIAQSGGTGADGMTFFIKDGADTSTTVGPAGGSLGYSLNGSTPGLSGALLGVGFDAFGGFAMEVRESANCATNNTWFSGSTVKNKLVVRGPGQGVDGYCLLAEPLTNQGWWVSGRSRADSVKNLRIVIDPSTQADPKVKVYLGAIADSDPPVVQVAQPTALSSAQTFKFGFTASTGGSWNNHDVFDVSVRSAISLGAPSFATPGQLPITKIDNFYSQSLEVRDALAPISFSVVGALPPGMSLNGGTLVGTALTARSDTFTITATDQRGLSVSREFVLVSQLADRALIDVDGGVVTDLDGYRYHAFTHGGAVATSTSATVTVTGSAFPGEVLIVGGGGGGGRNRAGGGGAGGIQLISPEVQVGTTSVEVGGGGLGGWPAVDGWIDREFAPGCSGVQSRFGASASAGGGGGGANSTQTVRHSRDCITGVTTSAVAHPDVHDGLHGQAGGSGGGGAYRDGLGGIGISGQGNNGATVTLEGGGGGGAGAVGTMSSGGDGVTTAAGVDLTPWGIATSTGEDISGQRWFSGGGAGFGSPRGSGGKGGGRSSVNTSLTFDLLDGLAGTGGGGAACAEASAGCRGGHGGSGVVILRYQVPSWGNTPTNLGTMTIGQQFTLGVTGSAVVEAVGTVSGASVSNNGVVANDMVNLSAGSAGTHTFTLRAFAGADRAVPTHYTDQTFTLNVQALPATFQPEPAAPESDDGSSTPAPRPGMPTLVTSEDAEDLRTPPSQASVRVNGELQEIRIERVDPVVGARTPTERTAEEIALVRTQARDLLETYNSMLPTGMRSTLAIEETETGAVLRGLFSASLAGGTEDGLLLIPVEQFIMVVTDRTALLLAALDDAGLPVAPSVSGLLELREDFRIGAAATGFAPGSQGEIVIFSDPVLASTFQVDAFGEFRGEFALPSGLAGGEHTIAFVTEGLIVTYGIILRSAADLSLPTHNELPASGGSVDTLWVLAVTLIGFGVGLLVIRPDARRLRKTRLGDVSR
jgi:hypothetical protein